MTVHSLRMQPDRIANWLRQKAASTPDLASGLVSAADEIDRLLAGQRVTADILAAAEDLHAKSECIRHWHDTLPNEDGECEGMVVSADAVRNLWTSTSNYEAARDAGAPTEPTTPTRISLTRRLLPTPPLTITIAMAEAALDVWFGDPNWQKAFAHHPCRKTMKKAIEAGLNAAAKPPEALLDLVDPGPDRDFPSLRKTLLQEASDITFADGKAMTRWDAWRARISAGDSGSAPRDGFESLMSHHADVFASAVAALDHLAGARNNAIGMMFNMNEANREMQNRWLTGQNDLAQARAALEPFSHYQAVSIEVKPDGLFQLGVKWLGPTGESKQPMLAHFKAAAAVHAILGGGRRAQDIARTRSTAAPNTPEFEWIALANQFRDALSPSRELDEKLTILAFPELDLANLPRTACGGWQRHDGPIGPASYYSSSLDAITCLIERDLAGWAWKTGTCSVSDDAWITPDFNSPIHGARLHKQFEPFASGSIWDGGIDIDKRPSGQVPIALCEAYCLAKAAIAAKITSAQS